MFGKLSGLNAHMRAVHRDEGEGFECDECGREFGYRSVRDRHVEAMHGQGSGGGGKKRGRSEKDKAFGRVDKKMRTAEGAGEAAMEVGDGEAIDSDIEQLDGGDLEGGRSAPLENCSHSTAISVM